MARNVTQMLQAVGAYVDQSIDLPTDDELTSRISYLDQAQEEWAESYDWDVLKVATTVGASGASCALPSNFKKMKSPLYDTTNNNTYEEIPASERYLKNSADKYVCVLGNAVTGKYLVINPTSVVTLSFDYLSFPTSLASLQDQTTCPNPKFIEERTIAYVLESRSDPRFPQVKADAQRTLNNMMTDQDAGSGGQSNTIPSFTEGVYVIGE